MRNRALILLAILIVCGCSLTGLRRFLADYMMSFFSDAADCIYLAVDLMLLESSLDSPESNLASGFSERDRWERLLSISEFETRADEYYRLKIDIDRLNIKFDRNNRPVAGADVDLLYHDFIRSGGNAPCDSFVIKGTIHFNYKGQLRGGGNIEFPDSGSIDSDQVICTLVLRSNITIVPLDTGKADFAWVTSIFNIEARKSIDDDPYVFQDSIRFAYLRLDDNWILKSCNRQLPDLLQSIP